MSRSPSSAKATAAESRHAVLDKWWQALHRAIVVQLVCSLLMQISYVAFPAYNFALALWCLVCCTPKWVAKNPRLALLVLGAVAISILTDIVWISLWVSGRVFYDQFCGKNGVSIVSCGGASDYYPGCTTNRFALFAMLSNDIAKIVSMVCLQRIQKLQTGANKKNTTEPPTSTTAPPASAPTTSAVAPRRPDVQQLPSSLSTNPSSRKLQAESANGNHDLDGASGGEVHG